MRYGRPDLKRAHFALWRLGLELLDTWFFIFLCTHGQILSYRLCRKNIEKRRDDLLRGARSAKGRYKLPFIFAPPKIKSDLFSGKRSFRSFPFSLNKTEHRSLVYASMDDWLLTASISLSLFFYRQKMGSVWKQQLFNNRFKTTSGSAACFKTIKPNKNSCTINYGTWNVGTHQQLRCGLLYSGFFCALEKKLSRKKNSSQLKTTDVVFLKEN